MMNTLLRKVAILFLLSFITLTIKGCSDERIPDEVKIEYSLLVSPESYAFPAEGGEVDFTVTAIKTVTTISGGAIKDAKREDALYTISVSNDAFSVNDFTIIATENRGEARIGEVIVSLNETELEERISLYQAAADDSPGEGEENEITYLRVLAIGNSFSEDAVEQYLYELADANGDTILIGNMYIGGATLERHAANSIDNSAAYSYRKIEKGVKTTTANVKLIDGIKDEEWDYISVQQASSLSGRVNTYFPYLEQLVAYIKEHATNPEVEIVFHATWAYAEDSDSGGFANYGRDQMTMYQAILNASREASEQVDITKIIPSGTAIQNGRTSSLGDTFCSDGTHLERNYGRYTASCTWYEELFKKSVIGNSYVPGTITRFQAMVAQHAAHHAVANPYQVTSLASLEEEFPMVPDLPYTEIVYD